MEAYPFLTRSPSDSALPLTLSRARWHQEGIRRDSRHFRTVDTVTVMAMRPSRGYSVSCSTAMSHVPMVSSARLLTYSWTRSSRRPVE